MPRGSHRSEKSYIGDIVKASTEIGQYLRGITKQQFEQSHLLQDGVIRQLGIIGEASANITEDTKDKNQDIPFRSMVGLRQIVYHVYWQVDLEQIWQIAKKEIPYIKGKVKQLEERG